MPAISQDLAALDKLQRHLFAHRHAQTSIAFAGETSDPANATAARAEPEPRRRVKKEEPPLLGSPETTHT